MVVVDIKVRKECKENEKKSCSWDRWVEKIINNKGIN